MVHSCYHEVTADSHAELGAKLGRIFGEWTHQDVAYMQRKKKWRRKVAASRDYLEQTFELTAHYFPNYAEELYAYSKVTGIGLADLWALNLEDELVKNKREKCTTVVTNGGKLISHNEDWESNSAEDVFVLKKTLSDLTVLEIYYSAVPLGGCAISINSYGYIQAINSLAHRDRQNGVPKTVIARWLSETQDIEADFKALERVPRSSGYNHVLVNTRGETFNIECTSSRQILMRPSLPFAHTNHYLTPELGDYDRATRWDSTFKRYARACRLMKPEMSVREIFALSGDRSEGRKASILNRGTIGRVTFDLENYVAKIWLKRERKAGWVDYPLDFLQIC